MKEKLAAEKESYQVALKQAKEEGKLAIQQAKEEAAREVDRVRSMSIQAQVAKKALEGEKEKVTQKLYGARQTLEELQSERESVRKTAGLFVKALLSKGKGGGRKGGRGGGEESENIKEGPWKKSAEAPLL